MQAAVPNDAHSEWLNASPNAGLGASTETPSQGVPARLSKRVAIRLA